MMRKKSTRSILTGLMLIVSLLLPFRAMSAVSLPQGVTLPGNTQQSLPSQNQVFPTGATYGVSGSTGTLTAQLPVAGIGGPFGLAQGQTLNVNKLSSLPSATVVWFTSTPSYLGGTVTVAPNTHFAVVGSGNRIFLDNQSFNASGAFAASSRVGTIVPAGVILLAAPGPVLLAPGGPSLSQRVVLGGGDTITVNVPASSSSWLMFAQPPSTQGGSTSPGSSIAAPSGVTSSAFSPNSGVSIVTNAAGQQVVQVSGTAFLQTQYHPTSTSTNLAFTPPGSSSASMASGPMSSFSPSNFNPGSFMNMPQMPQMNSFAPSGFPMPPSAPGTQGSFVAPSSMPTLPAGMALPTGVTRNPDGTMSGSFTNSKGQTVLGTFDPKTGTATQTINGNTVYQGPVQGAPGMGPQAPGGSSQPAPTDNSNLIAPPSGTAPAQIGPPAPTDQSGSSDSKKGPSPIAPTTP